MASITFAIDNETKSLIDRFKWINLSELARQEIIEQEKTMDAFKKFRLIVSKSKLTEKDARELSKKVNLSMHKDLKNKNLI